MYLYETGFKCDRARGKRADAIVQQTREPVFKEAVDTGSLSSWGWLAHHTGGEWSRAEYHQPVR